MIFTKLNTIDVFDSLTGVHERIDKILHGLSFANRLTPDGPNQKTWEGWRIFWGYVEIKC
jgi:hypothetical protein